MKIKHLKDPLESWCYFYNYCIKSKPYSFSDSLFSPRLRNQKIKKIFNELSGCLVYSVEEDNEAFAFFFMSVEKNFIHLRFAFGVSESSKFSHKKFAQSAYDLIDFLCKKYNKKYTKGEISRVYKVDAFKKWIEIFQKRVILFDDKEKTIVWCKLNRMSVKFKVVGANKATEHLMGKEAHMGFIRKGPRSLVRELYFGEKKYILDEKSVDFFPECVLVHGLLSDDKQNVGNIALEFKPQKIK